MIQIDTFCNLRNSASGSKVKFKYIHIHIYTGPGRYIFHGKTRRHVRSPDSF